MRVTFTAVNRNVQRNLSNRYSDMVTLQEQLATGKRLRKPSDSPIDVANDIKLRTKQAQLRQYERNIEDGLAIMGVASSAMNSMNDMLHRARELAVQAANGTYTNTDRTYMQKEVDQIFRQMMSVINTQFKGNYIFNGTNTRTQPYLIQSSDYQVADYTNRTMATYGHEFDICMRDTSVHHDPADSIYIDFGYSKIRIGDTLQLKWDSAANDPNIEDSAIINILPETFSLDSVSIADTGNPGAVVIFDRGIDYEFDHRTGQITILSEDMCLAANRARVCDDPTINTKLDQRNGAEFKYSLNNTFQIVGGKFGEPVTNLFPGSFVLKIGDKEYVEGFGEYQDGYYDSEGVYHKAKNVFDYSVDYETGKLTIYNLDLMRDMRPEWLGGPDQRANPNADNNYYRIGQLQMQFDYITRGTNIYGDMVASQGDIFRAIEMGIAEPINICADDMLRDRASGFEMVGVLLRYSQALLKDDRDGIQRALDELTSMYDAVLNSQSEMGAKIYRFELTQRRNEEQQVEVLAQQSALEDADLAEVISRLLLAENVYNASLQAAMRVIQPSLANYM